FDAALTALIQREIRAHKRIIFNGNGYDDAWIKEAGKRGLHNLASTPDALPHYTDKKNLQLFTRHGIYTPIEVGSREEILLDEYGKTINIEAHTMLDMLRKLILPACVKYSKEVAEGVAIKKQIGVDAPAEAALVRTITEKTAALAQAERTLTEKAAGVPARSIARIRARYYRDEVLPAMEEARRIADELEGLVAKDAWPMPTYSDILFYI
ncbi:MAG: glutamine synthetase type III, partial [Clostridiales bacterium]|nr:glutamine synthetase type III [Clostridiales bacterium]